MNDTTTKSKILDTMYRLVADRGYDKSSIGQIANAIGIKKASVYYYFESKEDIFLQLVRSLYQIDHFDATQLLLDTRSIPSYQQKMISMGEEFLDSYFENQNLRKVYAEIDIQTSRIPALKEIAKEADVRLNRFIADCLTHGVLIGAIPPDFDVSLHAQILYTILIGLDQAILYDLPVTPKAVWRKAITKLLDIKES